MFQQNICYGWPLALWNLISLSRFLAKSINVIIGNDIERFKMCYDGGFCLFVCLIVCFLCVVMFSLNRKLLSVALRICIYQTQLIAGRCPMMLYIYIYIYIYTYTYIYIKHYNQRNTLWEYMWDYYVQDLNNVGSCDWCNRRRCWQLATRHPSKHIA